MWRIVTPHYTFIGYFSIKIRDDCFDVNCCAGDSHTRTGLIDSVEFGGVVSKVNVRGSLSRGTAGLGREQSSDFPSYGYRVNGGRFYASDLRQHYAHGITDGVVEI